MFLFGMFYFSLFSLVFCSAGLFSTQFMFVCEQVGIVGFNVRPCVFCMNPSSLIQISQFLTEQLSCLLRHLVTW